MKLYSIIAVAVLLCVEAVFGKPKGDVVTEVLNTILNNYDSRVRPNYGDEPTVVTVTGYVIRTVEYSAKRSSLTLEAYYREMWKDPRLAYRHITGYSDNIPLGPEMNRRIWEPDSFVANGDLKHNGKDMFYRISPDGEVLKSVLASIEFDCVFYMRNFPLDIHICSLEFESYKYTASDVVYKFRDSHAISAQQTLAWGDLHLLGFQQKEQMIFLSSGNYSRALINIMIARDPKFHIKYFFVPAILTFVACWAVFWVPASAVLLRGILGLMCLKISMELMKKGAYDIPKYVGYMTKLDQYMVTCCVLSLVAILESVGVYYLYVHRPASRNHSEEKDDDEIGTDSKKVAKDIEKQKLGLTDYLDKGAKYALTLRQHRGGHAKVDLLFRIFYPIFFVLFNIIFWVVAYNNMEAQRVYSNFNLY